METYQPKHSKSTKVWVPELGLKDSDKQILLDPTGWLNDDIINAAQKLLKKANPVVPGLQSVACGLTMNFVIEDGEFVQILHTTQGHWNTISTIGMKPAEVQVFDSLYTCIPIMAKAQIANILATDKATIKLYFMDVQMQSGGCDCGLFAIAFATALVFGKHPGCFLFEQKCMRSHLLHCLESQEMTMFPTRKERRRHTELKVKSTDTYAIYCICRMPKLPNDRWIKCTSCKEWYHSDYCVSVSEEELSSKTAWYCHKCKK